MSSGLAVQYTIVALIVIGACVWMIVNFRKMTKKGSCDDAGTPRCNCCSMGQKCASAKNLKEYSRVRKDFKKISDSQSPSVKSVNS